MSDVALYVSLAANAAIALPTIAKAFKRKVDVDADVVEGLLKQVARLQVTCDRQEFRIIQLENEKNELERAREEAEAYAKALEASEKRSKQLYSELYDLYQAITGTHGGISVRPPSEWEEKK